MANKKSKRGAKQKNPTGYEYRVSYIQWDVDDPKDLKDLPDTIVVDVPEEVVSIDEEEDWISEYLSDTYGFCHFGFFFKPL